MSADPSAFSGIPFSAVHPYNADEATIVLRSFMLGLRGELASSSVLPPIHHAASKVRSEGALGWRGVWDVIPFQFGGHAFTSHPHLGAWLTEQEAGIQVVLPNGAAPYWKQLCTVNNDAFAGALRGVVQRIGPLRRDLGAGVWEPRLFLDVLQRHYYTRRGAATDDGRLRFDLDASFAGGNPAVKNVSAWLSAFRLVVAQFRQANMQLELQACYLYSKGSVSRNPQFAVAAAHAAEAMQPFIDLLLGE